MASLAADQLSSARSSGEKKRERERTRKERYVGPTSCGPVTSRVHRVPVRDVRDPRGRVVNLVMNAEIACAPQRCRDGGLRKRVQSVLQEAIRYAACVRFF
ncbi:unnamed protein product [Strongylus vulgaris]|uniref:Uncharacterized protein n=1 Tax=Strongylus vulgaris TaxID=40348 RepID=A0A3P7J908_STRVU|nr:unnamed protein product [Strongylus vulgaris]